MDYGARTITIGKPVSRSARRRARKTRRLRTYWAEIGFILLAVLFLQPQLLQTLVAAVATNPPQ